MIKRLLIANRGEIARRIIATSHQLGIETVAVFSDADSDAAFVQDADLAVGIGGNTPAESYLRTEAIIAAAVTSQADAIHPGYGFLAENAEFASAVAKAGLIFVGPSPAAMEAMGSKLRAKELMAEAGVPQLPSADLTGLDEDALVATADTMGYPLLIKASAGGGGRGMRIVMSEGQLSEAVEAASREAHSAFGDGTVFAERYLSPSRHVEVQIFGDHTGKVVHFHERECSIQRRHQKIIEEAPSPSLDEQTRSALHRAAVAAGEAIGYENAGTVEFLLGPPVNDGTREFYFLEVNTRLQVEHPVTEAVLGVDLVELQLSVAAGGPVPDQNDIGQPQGHAIEARLYAEDPIHEYRPSTGIVHEFFVPDGVRVDSALDNAGVVSQFYDPMIAKVISHGPTRQGATLKLARALGGARVSGITTNKALLVRTLLHPEFSENQADSEFLIRNDPATLGRPLVEGLEADAFACAAAIALQCQHRTNDQFTGAIASGFRNVPTSDQQVSLSLPDTVSNGETVAERQVRVSYRFSRSQLHRAAIDGRPLDGLMLHRHALTQASVAHRNGHTTTIGVIDLTVNGIRRQFDFKIHQGPNSQGILDTHVVTISTSTQSLTFGCLPRFVEPGTEIEPGAAVASMPGTIAAVKVKIGDVVASGDVLVVMEAMKMELAITAGAAGTVTGVSVTAGESIDAGTVLVTIE